MGPKKLHQKLHHTLWFWQVLISKKPNKNAYLHDEKQGEEKRGSTPLGGANRGNLLNASGLIRPLVFHLYASIVAERIFFARSRTDPPTLELLLRPPDCQWV